MHSMFSEAAAFNQLLSFDTSKVTDVRIYVFGVQQRNERPNSDFLFPIQLAIRCTECLMKQKPSINHYLSTLVWLQMWEIIFVWSLTAMRNQILNSRSLPNLSDELHVLFCNRLQSEPVLFWTQFRQSDHFSTHICTHCMRWQRWPDKCNWFVLCCLFVVPMEGALIIQKNRVLLYSKGKCENRCR